MNKINENDIKKIVKKILKESDDFVTGPAYSKKTELVDDVINRINEHGLKYVIALNKLNTEFPVERYKRIPNTGRRDFELPKGVKVKSSVFYDDDK
jgi:hypothetical protein